MTYADYLLTKHHEPSALEVALEALQEVENIAPISRPTALDYYRAQLRSLENHAAESDLVVKVRIIVRELERRS